MTYTISASLAAILASLASANATAQAFHFAREDVLGTSYALHVSADDQANAAQANARVLDEIRRLEGLLSGHRSDSEFSRLLREGKSNQLSQELMQVLQACDLWGERTNGAFHAAFAEASSKRRDAALPVASGYRSPWDLDAARGVAVMRASTEVGIDGLAKGYVIDRACAVALASKGVRGVTVDIGGDVRVAGGLCADYPGAHDDIFTVEQLEARSE